MRKVPTLVLHVDLRVGRARAHRHHRRRRKQERSLQHSGRPFVDDFPCAVLLDPVLALAASRSSGCPSGSPARTSPPRNLLARIAEHRHVGDARPRSSACAALTPALVRRPRGVGPARRSVKRARIVREVALGVAALPVGAPLLERGGERARARLRATRASVHSISSAMITGVRPTCSMRPTDSRSALASTMQPSLARGGAAVDVGGHAVQPDAVAVAACAACPTRSGS